MLKKPPALIFFLMLFLSFPLFADLTEEFRRIVNFSFTLKDFAKASPEELRRLTKELLIIRGNIVSTVILNEAEKDYSVRLELAVGDWVGTEQVQIYKCYLIFNGEKFYSLFPPQKRGAPKAKIAPNGAIIVLARFIELQRSKSGDRIPVLEGLDVKAID